jgi:hypothetical protein
MTTIFAHTPRGNHFQCCRFPWCANPRVRCDHGPAQWKEVIVSAGQWVLMSGCDWLLEAVAVAVRQEGLTHA